MKSVTRYLADDGTLFDEANKAAAHDALCIELEALRKTLRPVPKDDHCRFSNGHGFVRQRPEAVLEYQRTLVRIARRYFKPDDTYDRHFDYSMTDDKPTGHTFVGRLINEGCPAPVWNAWSRLSCMSEDFREFGQPYYALNPDKADQIDMTHA